MPTDVVALVPTVVGLTLCCLTVVFGLGGPPWAADGVVNGLRALALDFAPSGEVLVAALGCALATGLWRMAGARRNAGRAPACPPAGHGPP
ncbi:hypothetical protein I6A84_11975 [Frankia sp. CNm7]|uniref:Uncharacterized protein n=1 Tax=Frankia nepalensis TaxID=1836974 RepID=A0A937RE42_9ACTN|nr:hypothetical protein [Frankia nepalensis]MBL7500113.1 hypothetical protein [Frankia nepalensis]MBL7512430.1 hypothetical protein [Frankia nepalensis]MBL7518808.1 hypothetical protein [Frankia nepalensis]MBL7628567.1 hypothetical protein [Frankia nepalensis]